MHTPHQHFAVFCRRAFSTLGAPLVMSSNCACSGCCRESMVEPQVVDKYPVNGISCCAMCRLDARPRASGCAGG